MSEDPIRSLVFEIANLVDYCNTTDACIKLRAFVESERRSARLKEARWWRTMLAGYSECRGDMSYADERIAELEKAP